MGIRSFLAFSLPPGIRDVVERVLGDLSGASREVKWVRLGGVHLTVVFLGDVDEATLGPLKQAAAGVCGGFAPFRIRVNGTGFFPNPRRPRVIWLGLGGDVGPMGSLRDALQEALAPLGFAPERRPFRPHLTLGRFRRGGFLDNRLGAAIEKHRNTESPACMISELVLFQSDLRPTGAVYTALERFPLERER